MTNPQLDPGKVRKPMQMLATLIAGLIVLVGIFLTAGVKLESPSWAATMFFVTAVTIVPLFVGAVVLMWTKFRIHLQDDPYYSEWLKRQEKTFHGFRAENVATNMTPARLDPTLAAGQGEERRVKRYEENHGIFLVHRWRPSTQRDQVADIVIELIQHREGPLSAGLVESVSYYLGPKFFGGKPIQKKNARDNFRLEISAYGPVLCLAEVKIKSKGTIILERYVDFGG